MFGQVSLYSSYFIDPPWISAQPTPTSPTPNLAWASLILGVVGSCLVPKTSRVLRFLVAMLLDFVTAARELALLQARDSASATGAFPSFVKLHSIHVLDVFKMIQNVKALNDVKIQCLRRFSILLAKPPKLWFWPSAPQTIPNYLKLLDLEVPMLTARDLGANPPQNTTKITPPGPAVKISRTGRTSTNMGIES